MTQQADQQGLPERLFRFLASYGLAVVVLCFLFVLTLIGTLEQAQEGLYVVKQRYFSSLFTVHWMFDRIPVPLPGVYLLLIILTVNLVAGAILRAPKSWRRPGMLIAHGGILLLLAAGFVSFHYSSEGVLQLYEGESSNQVQDPGEWCVEIYEVAQGRQTETLIIPGRQLEHATRGRTTTFTSEHLPFDLVVSGYVVNSRPVLLTPGTAAPGLENVALEVHPKQPEREDNIPGCSVTIKDKQGSGVRGSVVWGRERFPYYFESGGKRWAVTLTPRRWTLPFSVGLDKFTVEMYPNTQMAKVFRSEVTKVEDGTFEKARIEMNEPLRHRGITIFQASWGPMGARPGERLYSGFAVVRNPADQWPLWACVVTGLGLLIHFWQTLWRYLRRSGRGEA